MELLATLPDLALPARPGPRPRTRQSLPHIQLDQWPPAWIAPELAGRSLRIPYVRSKQSRMASPSSLALCLPDNVAEGPPDAFIDDHEFCFLHALPEASIHLTLPCSLRDRVIRLGWAEEHPAAKVGVMPPTLVMLYAPRDLGELEIAVDLIRTSCGFAQGTLRSLQSMAALKGSLR
jgi:hypothetical protein